MGQYSKIKLIMHRLFSVSHLFLLYRNPKEGSFIENDYCWFKIMNNNDDLSDCAAFEDAEEYVPVYEGMIKNGDIVIFGYRKDDNRCFMRACVQLHGKIQSDGCYIKTLGNHEGYIHYVFCNVDDRGHGGHNSMISYICQELSQYRLYSIVKTNNTPSLKGFYRNGFKNMENLTLYNFGGLRRLYRKEVKE